MRALSVDYETWSEADIKLGSYYYATHPSTQAIMMSYHYVGDPAPPDLWWYGQPIPPVVAEHIARGWPVLGWNSLSFERLIWRFVCRLKYAWPDMPDWQWGDSMLNAVGANMPRSLDAAAQFTHAAVQKDKAGHDLVKELTVAKKTSWQKLWGPEKREKLIRFAAYCIDDVRAEEATAAITPPWITAEPWPRMPGVDMRINDRGIMADLPLIRGMRAASEFETARLDAEVNRVTNGQVERLSKVDELKTWLMARGVKLPLVVDPKRKPEDDVPQDEADPYETEKIRYRLRANDVIDLLAGDLPGDRTGPNGKPTGLVRDVLQMRADAAKISVKKLVIMENMAGVDDRLRSALILGGAQATMRWAGGIYQPHNFVRNTLPDGDTVERNFFELTGRKPDKTKEDKKQLAALKEEALDQAVVFGTSGDANAIRCVYGPVLPFVSRMLRRTLKAKPGHTFVQGDFAQVEARIIAWLAGQDNIVKAFADGSDVYSIVAASILDIPVEKVTKEQRQLGKVAVLGLGYAGGAGVFVVMSMNYGIRISREKAQPLVKKWREANPKIAAYWNLTTQAAFNAVYYPGSEFAVDAQDRIRYFMQGDCLCCRLPSGRLLRYWHPRIDDSDEARKENWGNPKLTALSIKGKSVTRRTLGTSILVENQDQAIAADLLALALDNMDRHGELPVVLHVHDSIAAEVPEDRAEALLPVFTELMTVRPAWAAGLPTAVDAHIGNRFG